MINYRVVLDTNVLLRAISRKSSLTEILDALYDEKYRLVISSEILLEYEEIVSRFYGASTAQLLLDFLLTLPNVDQVDPFFSLNLIAADADDNKFVDCAFAGNAHYVVTDDKHFRVLAEIDFPNITVLAAETFQELIRRM